MDTDPKVVIRDNADGKKEVVCIHCGEVITTEKTMKGVYHSTHKWREHVCTPAQPETPGG